MNDYESVSEIHFSGSNKYFLCAQDVNNIAIEGKGTIDAREALSGNPKMLVRLYLNPKQIGLAALSPDQMSKHYYS